MDNFKLASQQKLRFQTSKGSLSTEQLWDLDVEELDALAVSFESDYKGSAKKSFLIAKSEKDKTAKLRFDVTLDVLSTKVEAMFEAQQALEIKAHNKKIISLISEKQDESLKGKSIEELEALLK